MKRPTRTLLFLLFVLLFIIVTPMVLAYSQGYRVDWRKKMIVPTGALFLAPRPAPVEVFLDGKIKETSNMLFQNVFVSNLIPKSYSVQVSKPNYHTWQKTLSVSSKLVTEARSILLVPKNPKVREVAAKVRDFHASPSGKYFLLVEDSQPPEVYLYQIENAASRLLFKGSGKFLNFHVSSAQWNKDSTKVLLALEEKLEKRWMIIDIKENAHPQILDLTHELTTSKVKVDNFEFDPDHPAELFFRKGNALFSVNSENKKISQPILYDVLAYSVREDKIVSILENSPYVHILDRASNAPVQVTFNPPSPLQKNSRIFFPETRELTLLLDESLYIWNEKNSEFIKIADRIQKVSPSSDGKKLLLHGKDGILVYWLRDVHLQPFRDRGDLVSIVDAGDVGEDAVWLTKDNEHIIFAGKNSLYLTELDDRDRKNVYELAKKPVQRLFYQHESHSLYFLSRPILYFVSLK